MPIQIPNLDDRRYQELLDEALARIPVYTPEWTNFNKSDPGVTMIEVFAFLTESLLYRSNQIPERNRKKFLQVINFLASICKSPSGIGKCAEGINLSLVADGSKALFAQILMQRVGCAKAD